MAEQVSKAIKETPIVQLHDFQAKALLAIDGIGVPQIFVEHQRDGGKIYYALADEMRKWRASRAELVDAKPSAQTKAECDCPSLHGGRCMYPDCSQAASTGEAGG
jgi:hypothetical protein